MDWYTFLYLEWITSKDLLQSMGNSSQSYVAAWVGGEFGEQIYVCVCLSPFAVHPKLSQHYSSIGYSAIQNKKVFFFFFKKTTSTIYLLGQKGKWRSLNRGPPASLSFLQRLIPCQPSLNHARTHWWWHRQWKDRRGRCVYTAASCLGGKFRSPGQPQCGLEGAAKSRVTGCPGSRDHPVWEGHIWRRDGGNP